MKNRILNRIFAIILWIVLHTLGRISAHTAGRLARILAPMMRIFYPGAAKLIRANLATAFPEFTKEKINSILKQNLISTCHAWLDFIRILENPQVLSSLLEFPEENPIAHLPKQFILCLPHINGWELFAQLLPKFAPCAAVAATIPYPSVNELLRKSRSASGLVIIPREGALRASIRELAKGTNLGMLIDQNLSPRHGGIFVKFFGLPVSCSPAPAILASRMSIPIVTGAAIRTESGKFKITISELKTTLHQRPTKEELAILTQEIIAENEKLIRNHPEQYSWLYKRWISIPADTSPDLIGRFPFYAKKKHYTADIQN